MASRIVVVGAGQLGSRYLQGLIPISDPLDIVAVDPNVDALALAKERWTEARGAVSSHSLSTTTDIASLNGHVDLAIIATSSGIRLDVARVLAERCEVDNWILEKMLSSSPEGLRGFRKLFVESETVWVNLPYRIMEWHSALRTALDGKGPFSVTMDGEGYGLLTNSIHYIDLVGWLTKSTVTDIELELGSYGFFESKRAGYVECDGTFRVSYSDGSDATMSCRSTKGRSTPATALTIEIQGPHGSWNIDESTGLAEGPQGEILEGRIKFQSEITSGLVTSILAGRGCLLPPLSEVLDMHEKILWALGQRWAESPIFPGQALQVT